MSINLVIGCMFSGKTSHLINTAKINKLLDKKVIIINYISDTRYSSSDFVTTHDQISIKAIVCDGNILKLFENEEYKNSEVVCINEGQFFKNLVEFCVKACEDKKIVHVCGLDGDFRKRPFGEILNLIPHCETVKKLNALCLRCKDGTIASFTKRTVSSENLVLIASKDCYEAVCRKCYLT